MLVRTRSKAAPGRGDVPGGRDLVDSGGEYLGDSGGKDLVGSGGKDTVDSVGSGMCVSTFISLLEWILWFLIQM